MGDYRNVHFFLILNEAVYNKFSLGIFFCHLNFFYWFLLYSKANIIVLQVKK